MSQQMPSSKIYKFAYYMTVISLLLIAISLPIPLAFHQFAKNTDMGEANLTIIGFQLLPFIITLFITSKTALLGETIRLMYSLSHGRPEPKRVRYLNYLLFVVLVGVNAGVLI